LIYTIHCYNFYWWKSDNLIKPRSLHYLIDCYECFNKAILTWLKCANWMCFSAEIFSTFLYNKIFTTQHNAVCRSHTHFINQKFLRGGFCPRKQFYEGDFVHFKISHKKGIMSTHGGDYVQIYKNTWRGFCPKGIMSVHQLITYNYENRNLSNFYIYRSHQCLLICEVTISLTCIKKY
jgi:hypothetical protein